MGLGADDFRIETLLSADVLESLSVISLSRDIHLSSAGENSEDNGN